MYLFHANNLAMNLLPPGHTTILDHQAKPSMQLPHGPTSARPLRLAPNSMPRN
jgi:hypothetical protein